MLYLNYFRGNDFATIKRFGPKKKFHPNVSEEFFCSNKKFSTKIVSLKIDLLLFSTVLPSNICMLLSFRPFVVITTLSKVLVGVEVTCVSCSGQLTVGV